MNFQDLIIRTRETVLSAVLGMDGSEVLNSAPSRSRSAASVGPSLAAEIKSAINTFKSIAIDQTGRQIDYPALAGSQAYREFQERCTPQLRGFEPAALETIEDRLAFWINLYNAMVIDAVIRFEIRRSVVEGFVGILRFFRRAAYQIGGQRVSLDDIEQGILRANRGNPYFPGRHFSSSDPRRSWVLAQADPRVHFALTCATQSCPPIGVYSAERIDAQLDLATQSFLTQQVRIDYENKQVFVSQILNWYRSDFGGPAGLAKFLIEHLSDDHDRAWLAANSGTIRWRYDPYEWSLNI